MSMPKREVKRIDFSRIIVFTILFLLFCYSEEGGEFIYILESSDVAEGRGLRQVHLPPQPRAFLKGHWSPSEDTKIRDHVALHGPMNWNVPHKVLVEEADGSVKFDQGEESAYLFHLDIYTDDRISGQGIDGVLFPVEDTTETPSGKVTPTTAPKLVTKQRRGTRDKYFEVCVPLYEASITADWAVAERIFSLIPEGVWSSITENHDMSLHVSASAEETMSMSMSVYM